MAQARIIQRKRILATDLKAAREKFGRRGSQNADSYRSFLLGKATNYVLTPESSLDEFNDYANTWGFVQWPGDPRELQGDVDRVREELVQEGDILTELLVPADPDGMRPPQGQVPPSISGQREDGPANAGAGDENLPTEDVTREQLLERVKKEAIGVDLAISPSFYSEAHGHWSSAKNGAPTFGSARDAMRLINAPWASNSDFTGREHFDGQGVNVVIVDEGLSAAHLSSIHPGVNFQGGFVSTSPSLPLPGLFRSAFSRAPSSHGNMIARNILRIAPNAKIYDAPILPPRVTNIPTFTSTVQQLYQAIFFHAIKGPFPKEPWIVVNAWAVANSISQFGFGIPSAFLYTSGQLHPTNLFIQLFGKLFDVVFAAGNFGEFATVPGAGLYDRGPERSIKGANALSNVLTVGACDVTGCWIGTSSQGDGPTPLKYGQQLTKPDLMAPSWFDENNDSATSNTGTSAACAVAAGIMAGLRTRANRADTPSAFRTALRAQNPGSVAADAWRRAGQTILTF